MNKEKWGDSSSARPCPGWWQMAGGLWALDGKNQRRQPCFVPKAVTLGDFLNAPLAFATTHYPPPTTHSPLPNVARPAAYTPSVSTFAPHACI